jgi:toxin ParE1/3/4
MAPGGGAADRLIVIFFEQFGFSADQPEIGVVRPEFAGGDPRIFPLGSYVIFYRLAKSVVEIVRVLHGARDLNAILG